MDAEDLKAIEHIEEAIVTDVNEEVETDEEVDFALLKSMYESDLSTWVLKH